MISLREFTAQDVQSLVHMANNFNVSKYLTSSFPYPYTEKDAEWWINEGCKEAITRVIAVDGQLAGAVSARRESFEHSYSAEIGYWLGEEFWGRGIASVALTALTNEVLTSTDLVRLYARVFSPNKASGRVLEKCGYSLEARLQKHIYKNGEFMDELVYTKIR